MGSSKHSTLTLLVVWLSGGGILQEYLTRSGKATFASSLLLCALGPVAWSLFSDPQATLVRPSVMQRFGDFVLLAGEQPQLLAQTFGNTLPASKTRAASRTTAPCPRAPAEHCGRFHPPPFSSSWPLLAALGAGHSKQVSLIMPRKLTFVAGLSRQIESSEPVRALSHVDLRNPSFLEPDGKLEPLRRAAKDNEYFFVSGLTVVSLGRKRLPFSRRQA